MNDARKHFVEAVRGYTEGKMDWDSVHERSLGLIEANADEFEGDSAIQALHFIFLADSRDDPQFRADDSEIKELIPKAERELT